MSNVSNTINKSGTQITVVANYSALPDPTTVSGKFYWCSNSEGTKFIGILWGGTYRNAGQYYSNGVSWEYQDTPAQATQSEVNTGTNTDKFVTPETLKNSSQFQYLDATSSIQTQLNNRVKIIIRDPTDSSTLTGTTANTILKSWFIPANTFSASDLMFVQGLDAIMTGANSARTVRMYVNTANTIPATAIRQVSITSANIYTQNIDAKFIIKGGNIEFPTITSYTSAQSAGNSSSATRQTLPFDTTVDNYFIIAGQLGNGLDGLTLTGGQMTN